MARQKIVIATEKWATKNGEVYKAVVRTADGKFLGATNQTTNIPVKQKAQRKRTPTLFLVGK
jgi:hypothetical protein